MTIEEARAAARIYMQHNNPVIRSCWNCNLAHEHLKNAEYPFMCAMGCGHWFYKGVDITKDENA